MQLQRHEVLRIFADLLVELHLRRDVLQLILEIHELLREAVDGLILGCAAVQEIAAARLLREFSRISDGRHMYSLLSVVFLK